MKKEILPEHYATNFFQLHSTFFLLEETKNGTHSNGTHLIHGSFDITKNCNSMASSP